MPPQAQIRGYELLERIGTGAESSIYRARDLSADRIVAIKHICIDESSKYKYIRHILNEHNTLTRLQNGRSGPPLQGVVRVYKLLRFGLLRRRRECALVMQYVEGRDLRKERRYPTGQLVDILMQVARTLSGLHNRGYIHGDLKPENIVVAPTGCPTLVDFGFSCRAGTPATSIRGTRDYMAPEQVNMGRLTEKTDIYNFGATMYFLLTGRFVPALIPAQNDAAHFIASTLHKPVAPIMHNPSIPRLVNELIVQCIQSEPIKRPSCIEEVLDILKDVRAGFPMEDVAHPET